MLLRSSAKRKASKSIPDETEVKSKFKRCLADSTKYGQFGKISKLKYNKRRLKDSLSSS